MELTNLKVITGLLDKYQQNTKKFLGQNFLTSREVLDAIVEAANIQENEQIIEVGPGLGVLTKELALKSNNVTSLEIDKTLFPILKETVPEHVNIIHQDALQFTPPSTPYKIVANIPYYITSPLINHFLQADNPPTSMTLLTQKEVAEKICKQNPDMTVLSLQVALFGEAKLIRKVANTCFHPAPKVESAILHIEINKKLPTERALEILKLAKRAFRNRRKKLSNTLKDYMDKLVKLDFQDKRPQHLSIEDWEKLV